MADLFLISLGELKSRPQRRNLVQKLRETAKVALPMSEPHFKVGSLNHGRFKIELPGGEGTVDHAGATFDLDEPDFTVISLIYALARAGSMAIVDSWGPSSTILFDRAQLKTLPPELRRLKPALCASAAQLARMLEVSTETPRRSPPKLGKKYQWSKDHNNRYLGRLPGLTEDPEIRYIYIETKSGEGLDLLIQDWHRYLRAQKKQGKTVPQGGGLSSMYVHKELRLPGGEIFIPLDVTGYECRPNADHLVPANIERWLAIARAFGRATSRKTGMILRAKSFVLDTGRRYPLSRLESRTAPESAD